MTSEESASNVRRISNSEVATWLACQRKYYYEFDLALEPLKVGTALNRGIILHDILAKYYEGLKNGLPHSVAMSDARARLSTYMAAPNADIEVVMEVDRLLQGYWAHYQGDPDWEILQVESGHDLAMTDAYEYSLRLDLLVRERSTGKTILVDHKTCYNFWTEDEMDLNPQFPKYIGALRSNGVTVDKAILNQIRTRVIKNPSSDQLFRRAPYTPSRAKVANALREQVIASQQIVRHREQPLDVRANMALRVLNKQVCQYCDSKPLCLSEYDGGDITHMIATDYKPRTYGYNHTEPTAASEL
jgi:hypothetical protein